MDIMKNCPIFVMPIYFTKQLIGLLINVAGIRLPAALNIRFLADGAGEKPGNFL